MEQTNDNTPLKIDHVRFAKNKVLKYALIKELST